MNLSTLKNIIQQTISQVNKAKYYAEYVNNSNTFEDYFIRYSKMIVEINILIGYFNNINGLETYLYDMYNQAEILLSDIEASINNLNVSNIQQKIEYNSYGFLINLTFTINPEINDVVKILNRLENVLKKGLNKL